MNKKVLQINIVCGVGSTGRIAKDLSDIMYENYIENYIAYGYGKSDLKNAIKIGTKFEYYIHNILSRITGKQGRFSYFATKRFLKKVDKIKPDIIHLHNIHGNYINYPLLFKYIKNKNIKVVWSLHDCWPFTGKCTHFEYVNCDKWMKLCYNCPQLERYPKSYFFDRSKSEYKKKKKCFNLPNSINIVTPSEWLLNKVKKSFFYQCKMNIINNGIDLQRFKRIDNNEIRTKYNLENKFIILGIANNWVDRKGLDSFVELSKRLDKNFKIILVGLSEKQKDFIPDNIIKIAKTNSIEELTKIYSCADVFVNPTLEDNFPTVNIEALACGTPVITYDTGGSKESIDDKCGIAVEKNNIDELEKAINELKQNNFNSKDCIERANKYNKKECYMNYIELYDKILNEKEEN